jgi:hypothetical protein
LTPALAQALQGRELSEAQVEALLRSLAEVEPTPGEPAHVRAFLEELRFRTETDPRIQPALGFDPEVEL